MADHSSHVIVSSPCHLRRVSLRETEDTHQNTATSSKQRRRGRTDKDSSKEGDERELHVGRG